MVRGLYPSLFDVVEVLNTLLQERQKCSENSITFKVSHGTERSKNYFLDIGSVLDLII